MGRYLKYSYFFLHKTIFQLHTRYIVNLNIILPMKRSITLKQNDFANKKGDIDVKLEPKQSTIDFLMNYSRILHIEKLKKGETVELILN